MQFYQNLKAKKRASYIRSKWKSVENLIVHAYDISDKNRNAKKALIIFFIHV